jgi:hypothetical protein
MAGDTDRHLIIELRESNATSCGASVLRTHFRGLFGKSRSPPLTIRAKVQRLHEF